MRKISLAVLSLSFLVACKTQKTTTAVATKTMLLLQLTLI